MKTYILAAGILWGGAAVAQTTAPETYEQARTAARAKYEARDFEGARQAMERALKLATTPGEKSAALMRIGQALSDQKQFAAARATWQQVLELPGSPSNDVLSTRLAIATSWQYEGQHARTRAELEAVAALPEADSTLKRIVQFGVAGTYFNEKDFEHAREAFATIADDPKAEPYLRYQAQQQIGEAHFKERDFAAARAAWEKVLALPQLRPALAVGAESRIADTYSEEKNPEQAEKVRGQFFAAHSKRVQPLIDVGKLAEAREEATAMMVLLPTRNSGSLTLQTLIGELYLREGNFDQAREQFQSIADLTVPGDESPKNIESVRLIQQSAQERIGIILVAQGKPAEARAQFEKVLKLPNLDASLKAATEKALAGLPAP